MNKTKICAAFIAMTAASFANAQDAAQLERVEVTGSNIRRLNAETASPVQTITREDIDKSGRASVAELLQTLSVDNQGSVPKSFGNGFASGGSGVSLRGLGAASTLVLLNGRRLAPYGLADDGQKVFTDLNVIPLDAVERIEILKDGGSAIYGSDAIAGVVNVILRKDYQGLLANVSYGQSRYSDGREKRASLTGGFGDLVSDGYNFLANLEVGAQDEAYYRNRTNRDYVGRTDLRDRGFTAQDGLGGTGAILNPNAAGAAINGNVRNPATLNYYNRGDLAGVGFTRVFPGAACSNLTDHAQGDPGGGCLIDGTQAYAQVQPSQKYVNLFGRGSVKLGDDHVAYAEGNYYNNKSRAYVGPNSVSSNEAYPGGPVSNAAIALGAAHPDNPYFGTAARLRYLSADVGPRIIEGNSDFYRALVGVKGTVASWDYDTAFLFSETKFSQTRRNNLQRDVEFALLNPTGFNLSPTMTNAQVAAASNAAYAALPVGTYWRIGENARLNSSALYAALAPDISNQSTAKVRQVDLKASRELMALPGGPLGLALGAEVRRETSRLTPITGTERGNIVGLGFSAFDGARTVAAGYAELLAPVLKQLEISAAVRYDHYSDVGSSTTPKFGIKYTPVNAIALRGTYARGFRAPSPPENGTGSVAFFTSAVDPLRCALGIAAACASANVAGIIVPNRELKPETSNNFTFGMVLEPTSRTSIALDYFDLKRKNEINAETVQDAIAAGHVVRDPSTAVNPQDPGAITVALSRFINSNVTRVRGVDLDARQGFDLGRVGKATVTAQWTHLFSFKRTDPGGETRDFAGTHGLCDVSNCAGTPADKVNFGAFVDAGAVRIGTNVTYRASIEARNYKGEPGCGATFVVDGSPSVSGCRISSFTSVDLIGRWLPTRNLEIYGSVRNLFDRNAPFDPFSAGSVAGGVSYNPVDTAGVLGRFFSLGVKYKFL